VGVVVNHDGGHVGQVAKDRQRAARSPGRPTDESEGPQAQFWMIVEYLPDLHAGMAGTDDERGFGQPAVPVGHAQGRVQPAAHRAEQAERGGTKREERGSRESPGEEQHEGRCHERRQAGYLVRDPQANAQLVCSIHRQHAEHHQSVTRTLPPGHRQQYGESQCEAVTQWQNRDSE
jgi:hypothetical protein